jgi:hypothetical protein
VHVLSYRPPSIFIRWSGGLIRVYCRAFPIVIFLCEDFVRAVVGDMSIMALHKNRKKFKIQ